MRTCTFRCVIVGDVSKEVASSEDLNDVCKRIVWKFESSETISGRKNSKCKGPEGESCLKWRQQKIRLTLTVFYEVWTGHPFPLTLIWGRSLEA